MAESPDSEDEISPLNEVSRFLSNDDESQVALTSGQNQCGVSVLIPAFNLNEGSFDRPNFGPVTNKKHVEANKIEHATIIHNHYHGPERSQPAGGHATPNGTREGDGSADDENIPKGYVGITDDIYMYTKEPMKKGTSVYRGFQLHVTGQKEWVAVKKKTPCCEKSKREVQHLVNLTRKSPHPNIVKIFRSKIRKGPTHEELYIITELCKQQNLQDYFEEIRKKNKPFDLKEALSFAKQLVDAVSHIHSHGIIHGDLKPENILFSLDGKLLKVSDFGISKQLRDSKSNTMLTGGGTDGYRAPETYQASEEVTKSADVYSFAINLYALFSNGKHPYGEDKDLWRYNMKKNTGLDLSGLEDEIGPLKAPLVTLLKKAFQLDPKKRPNIEAFTKFCSRFELQSKEGRKAEEDSQTYDLQLRRPQRCYSTPPRTFTSSKLPERFYPSPSSKPLSNDQDPILQEAPIPQSPQAQCFAPSTSSVSQDSQYSYPTPSTSSSSLAPQQGSDTRPSTSYVSVKPRREPYSRPLTASVCQHSSQRSYPNPQESHPTLSPDFIRSKNHPRPYFNPQNFPGISKYSEGYNVFTRPRQSGSPKKSKTLRRLKNFSIDLETLEWHVTYKSLLQDLPPVPDINVGCRIFDNTGGVFDVEAFKQESQNVMAETNNYLQPIEAFHSMELKLSKTPYLWPGILIWFDRGALQLFAVNICHGGCDVEFRNECERYASFQPLQIGVVTPVYSASELIGFVELSKKFKERLSRFPGVEFRIPHSLNDGNFEEFQITPHGLPDWLRKE